MGKNLNLSYRNISTAKSRVSRIDLYLFLFPAVALIEYYSILAIFIKLFKLF